MVNPKKVLPTDHPLSAYRETWEYQYEVARRIGLPERVARERADLHVNRLRAIDAENAVCAALPDCPLRESLLEHLTEWIKSEEETHQDSVRRLSVARDGGRRPRKELPVYQAALRFFQDPTSADARRKLIEVATDLPAESEQVG